MKLKDFEDGTFSVGKVVGVASARVESARTTPPERYTEQSLLEDMTSAAKFAKDEDDRRVLSSISGLGTSRTRAGIIANLIKRGFLQEQSASLSPTGRGRGRKVLVSTPEGRSIAANLPGLLTSVATTARWEAGFRMVEEGKATAEQMQIHLDRALGVIVEEAKRQKDARASQVAAAPVTAPSKGALAATDRPMQGRPVSPPMNFLPRAGRTDAK